MTLPGPHATAAPPDRPSGSRPDPPARPAPEGFAEFVATRSHALRATAWLLTGDRDRAEDLVQESLARAWQAWLRIRRGELTEAYVRQVMINLNVSWWRRRWRGESPHDLMPERPVPDGTGQADLRDAVRRALAGLPARQRAVLVLRYFEDWTEAQTATALGCSVGTVKSQAHRAIARLRTDPQVAALLDAPSPLGGAR